MVGTLNGAMKVYVDAYAADSTDVLVGYSVSKRVDDPHSAVCTSLLMSPWRCSDPIIFQPVVSHDRYGYIELLQT